MVTVTADDLRELLNAPTGTALVVEEGEIRIVPTDDAATALPVMARADLVALLGDSHVDANTETLRVLADGLGGDLTDLDLSHGPPFSPVWDPVAVAAGQVAAAAGR